MSNHPLYTYKGASKTSGYIISEIGKKTVFGHSFKCNRRFQIKKTISYELSIIETVACV